MDKILMNLRQAIASLRGNVVRSTLTMSGIIIGIAAVILLIGIGKGAQLLLVEQVEGLGSNTVFFLAGGDGGQRRGPPAAARGIITTTMGDRDLKDIRDKASSLGIRYVSGYTTSVPITFKEEGEDDVVINVRGRDRNFFLIQDSEFDEGGPWTERDEEGGKKVAILGGTAKERLFGEEAGSVIGERIKIKNQNYEVVGVLTKKEGGITSFIGQSEDLNIVIPTKVMQQQVQGVNHLFGLMIEIIDQSEEATERVIDEVELILRDNHRLKKNDENDFSIRAQKDALDLVTTITDIFTVFLAAIAGLSLLVGGIGIMNIMFVSVTERTFEIGLRKAMGAQNRDILLQFVTEAIMLTVLGGIVGVCIGVLAVYGISLGAGWTFFWDFEAIGQALAMSFIFGVVFGVYPAFKASKLEPINALRYE